MAGGLRTLGRREHGLPKLTALDPIQRFGLRCSDFCSSESVSFESPSGAFSPAPRSHFSSLAGLVFAEEANGFLYYVMPRIEASR